MAKEKMPCTNIPRESDARVSYIYVSTILCVCVHVHHCTYTRSYESCKRKPKGTLNVHRVIPIVKDSDHVRISVVTYALAEIRTDFVADKRKTSERSYSIEKFYGF